jgi:hypothetical protein
MFRFILLAAIVLLTGCYVDGGAGGGYGGDGGGGNARHEHHEHRSY